MTFRVFNLFMTSQNQLNSMTSEPYYKINELFETIQGEGSYTGQPSIFIRLQGCPVACSWCDTKHTWAIELDDEISSEKLVSKQVESSTWAKLSVDDILAVIQSQGYLAKHIVITGGEPCMYDLTPLCHKLEGQGFSCQVETSGTFDINVSDQCLSLIHI